MFSDLADPRAANAHHRLSDLLLIALAASLCGAQGASDYAPFGRSKRPLLETVIGPFDPPSHDTFSRVFRFLDPEAFASAFAAFVRAFAGALEGVVAIDGKAARRGGATVTADALHCHRRMAAATMARGGACALTLKGNQSGLKRDAERLLAAQAPMVTETVSEVSHGRKERRTGRVVSAGDMDVRHRFEGLAAIAEIICERDGEPQQRRLYLLSRSLTPAEAIATVRTHWSIENTLHWSLDVTLGEDHGRARTGHAPANIALLGRIAISLLHTIHDPGTSLRRKINRCAWEDDYLINAIAHMQQPGPCGEGWGEG